MGRNSCKKGSGSKRPLNGRDATGNNPKQPRRMNDQNPTVNSDLDEVTINTNKGIKTRSKVIQSIDKDVRRVLIKPATKVGKNNNDVPTKVKSVRKSVTKGKKVIARTTMQNEINQNELNLDEFDQQPLDDIDTNLSDSDAAVDHDGIEVEVEVHQSEDDLDRDMATKVVQPQPGTSTGMGFNKFKFDDLRTDPSFNRFLNDILDEKLKDRKADEAQAGLPRQAVIQAPPTQKPSPVRAPPRGIKSPSDSTLYTPALNRANKAKQADDLLNKITNFVEGIRMDSSCDADEQDNRPQLSNSNNETPDKFIEMERTQEHTDNLVLQAEQFKAAVSAPKGRSESVNSMNMNPMGIMSSRPMLPSSSFNNPFDIIKYMRGL